MSRHLCARLPITFRCGTSCYETRRHRVASVAGHWAGLWYVFHDQQKRAQIADALRQADRTWIIFGWLCYSLVEVLATVRWQMLLLVQGITIGWLRAFAIVMIGLFFNMFLPGLVGGDAVRLYFVFKCAPRQKRAPRFLSR